MDIKDCLNRELDKKNVLNLIKAAKSRRERLSFAVDGRWGSGKTFFTNLLSEELSKEFFVFRYDSWDNDYYEDPLIGMLDSIKDRLNKIQLFDKTLKEASKEIIVNIISVIGIFVDNAIASKIGFKPIKAIKKLKETWNGWACKAKLPDDFNPYNKVKAAKQLIIASMNELSEVKPIVFIIDEIDRCFPTYTLKIIERIHHVSENVNNCITIFSVDKKQLQRIIELVYEKGDNNLVDGYLRKVIDFTYDLGAGDLSDAFFNTPEYKDYETRFGAPIKGIDETDIRRFVKELFYKTEMRTILKIINDAKYTHDLVFSSGKQTKELLCAELMFAWAAMRYKGNIIEEFRIEFSSSSNNHFVKYLSSRPGNEKLTEYHQNLGHGFWVVYISDLKSLMAYYLLRRETDYFPRFSSYGAISDTPTYFSELLGDYVPSLSKIRC